MEAVEDVVERSSTSPRAESTSSESSESESDDDMRGIGRLVMVCSNASYMAPARSGWGGESMGKAAWEWECAREWGREPTAPSGGELIELCELVGEMGLEGARIRPPPERLNTVGDCGEE